MAVVGGLLWALYLHIGRGVRQRVGIATYMGLVCVAATVFLWPACLLTATPLVGFDATTWLLIAGAIVGPQLIGHQGFNYAVRYLPASSVSAVMLLEPVGATLLAAAVLGEVPPLAALGGGVLVLAGILAATLSRAPDAT